MKRPRWTGPILATALALSVAAARAATPVHAGDVRPSAVPGFTIDSCTYYLADSKAGNRNYYLYVDVKYTASRPISAVRFTFHIDDAVQNAIWQRFAAGNGSHEFKLISPAPTISGLTCAAQLPLPSFTASPRP
jgi:hypothetical protein